MIKKNLIPAFAIAIASFTSCGEATTTATNSDSASTEMASQDPATIKAEIVAIETAWADALNKKDIDALMALYADDAVTLPDGKPAITGKENIRKMQQEDFKDSTRLSTVSFETLDVFGQGEIATEVGKQIFKDVAGKTIATGKYVVVFEKRDGKWLCIREIYNGDSR